jgi:hypothetical protein
MRLLVIGIAIAAAVWLASAGHVFFLPIPLVLPLGLISGRRRRRRPGRQGHLLQSTSGEAANVPVLHPRGWRAMRLSSESGG